jgi:hypothetical protein
MESGQVMDSKEMGKTGINREVVGVEEAALESILVAKLQEIGVYEFTHLFTGNNLVLTSTLLPERVQEALLVRERLLLQANFTTDFGLSAAVSSFGFLR